MKSCFCPVLCLITILINYLSSCDSNASERIRLGDFTKEQIKIPDKLLCIEGSCLKDTTLSRSKRMVIYIDSQECSICRIDNLGCYIALMRLCENYGVDFIILFSPRTEQLYGVIKHLLDIRYPFPVYIDNEAVFATSNEHIPSSQEYHSFLLNENNYPIYVGDPVYSKTEKAFKLLKRVLRYYCEK